MNGLQSFLAESLLIEGIDRPPTGTEIEATSQFLALPTIAVVNVVDLVAVYAPRAQPRFTRGLNVVVGSHVPPAGGPDVRRALAGLLGLVNDRKLSPHEAHCRYEDIHPFTDGNGRSGRAIWLWQMGGRAPLGFLHHFYYQTLAASGTRREPIGATL